MAGIHASVVKKMMTRRAMQAMRVKTATVAGGGNFSGGQRLDSVPNCMKDIRARRCGESRRQEER